MIKMTEVGRNTNENLESLSLIWLDHLSNKSKENVQIQKELRKLINHLVTFDDHSQCLEYIQSTSKDDQIIFICSGSLAQLLVPQISPLRQVISIYIYCMEKNANQLSAKEYDKVKGVIVQSDDLIHQIRREKVQQEENKNHQSLSLSIFQSNMSNQGQSTSGLNGEFIHRQLLLDCLIRMKANSIDRNELIFLCKEQYQGNASELKIIEEFEKDYLAKRALWWYTRESFLYRLLNKALRVQNIDLLFLFAFFIRDIGEELERNKCLLPIRVYRGQMMSTEEVQTLQKIVGEFFSVNSFLSTSLDRRQARAFLSSSDCGHGFERVLFEIDANPRLDHVKSFSNITSLSYFPGEDQILFMAGSIFRLITLENDKDGIWIIRIVLCSDDDLALKHFYLSLEIAQKALPSEHADIAKILEGIAVVYELKGEFEQASLYLEKSSKMFHHLSSSTHPDVLRIEQHIHRLSSKRN